MCDEYRLGREYVERGRSAIAGSCREKMIGDNPLPCGLVMEYCRPRLGSGLARESADGLACLWNDPPAGARADVAPVGSSVLPFRMMTAALPASGPAAGSRSSSAASDGRRRRR